jgi:ribosome-associated protein
LTQENNKKTETTVEKIVQHILEKKGENITVIDIRGISSITDYFVLATGSVGVQVKAIADEVRLKMKNEESELPWHVEGYDSLKWVLLDYVDVVVHIFDAETREYYSLEKLWEDAKIKHIKSE